nr:mucin-6 [Loxodonta africana]
MLTPQLLLLLSCGGALLGAGVPETAIAGSMTYVIGPQFLGLGDSGAVRGMGSKKKVNEGPAAAKSGGKHNGDPGAPSANKSCLSDVSFADAGLWGPKDPSLADPGADYTPDPEEERDMGSNKTGPHTTGGRQGLCPAWGPQYSCLVRREGDKPVNTLSTDEQRGWCSTWGAGHFSTFDHHVYNFSGTCNYVFAAICKDPSPTFSVQLRRGSDGTTARIIMELGSSVVTVQSGVVSVKDVGVVSLPYTSNGLQITPFGQNVRLVAKQLELELEVLWGPDGYVMVRTAGVLSGGTGLSGLCWRLSFPEWKMRTTQQADRVPKAEAGVSGECRAVQQVPALPLPSGPGGEEVHGQDVRAGKGESRPASSGPAGLGGWGGSRQHAAPGSPSPAGMVLDDLSKNQTCVPITQCPCMFNGAVYAPGEVTSSSCRTCQCSEGLWKCTEQPCPGRCSLEGGSFVTTFDARPYRFHGTCTYILLQSHQLPEEGSLMAVYDKSGYSHSETSLVAIIYLSGQDKIMISQDEVITNNREVKWLPYKIGNITIFRQTSTHLQMATDFGLELMIQLQPVFQAYVTVEPQFRGQTRGLCGNYNGDTTDDFMTSMGITEGTASLFVDSWRAGNCPTALERETDPCSMSQLNKVCAETHCSVLVKKGSVFEKCHSVVNPQPFYKRCVYQACNYEETFPHICAALGAYAHLCASHGVLLWDWRSSVDNCTIPCTGNTTFSYNSEACNRTCMSLSDHTLECHPSAVPVDGCNCPEGTYLNHKAECVRKGPVSLPSWDSHEFIFGRDSPPLSTAPPCYCINGRLTCSRKAQTLLATCTAPKTFQSCSQSSESKFGAACAPTCQMLATGIACVPTKCEPGCVCAEGLYEDANGQCVPPSNCSCEFGGASYPTGAELNTDCQTCTCKQGKWVCQQSTSCASTCTLYGEGHMITFDGQRFVFDGNCEYTLTTDGCSTNDSQPTFKIVTENVICGKSGVTCSRAIKLFLGALSIVLADKTYTVSGHDPQVSFQVQPGSMHLVLEVYIAGKYNLTLTWNKHMMVLIKVSRTSAQVTPVRAGGLDGAGLWLSGQRLSHGAHRLVDTGEQGEGQNMCWEEKTGNMEGAWNSTLDKGSVDMGTRSPCSRGVLYFPHTSKCRAEGPVQTREALSQAEPWPQQGVFVGVGGGSGLSMATLSGGPGAQGLRHQAPFRERSPPVADSGNGLVAKVCMAHRVLGAGPAHTRLSNLDAHPQVYHMPYYEACVRDTCGCDTGGDCECLCDAVAAYAKACLDKGVCVDWRSPDFCRECLGVDGIKRHQAVPSLPPQGPHPSHPRSPAHYTGHTDPQNQRAAQFCPTLHEPWGHTCGPYSDSQPASYVHGQPTGPFLCTDRYSPHCPHEASCLPRSSRRLSSAESPRSTTAITPRVTSAPTPTSTRRVTATRPTVTQATSHPTASHPTTATQTTAESHRAHHSSYGTPTALEETSSILPGERARQAVPKHSPHPSTQEGPTGHGPHTSAVPASHGEYSVGSSSIVSCASAEELDTGRASGGGLHLHGRHGHYNGATNAHTIPRDHASDSDPAIGHLLAQAHGSTPSTSPFTKTTTATGSAHSSVSTAKTTSPPLSLPPSTAPPSSTSPPRTTITTKPTSRATGTPVPETTLPVSHSQPHTTFTTLSQPTVSASSSSRSTGPPTGTSFKTTTTLPIPSSPKTTLPTPAPPVATSSVTPTSQQVTTLTPAAIKSSSSPLTTATSRPTTAAPSTGTQSTPSTSPFTKTTTATGSAHSSISTAKTTSPPLSLPPSTAPPSSTSPPHTTITTKPTSRATGTPVPETTSPVSHSRPHTNFTTPSQPTVSASSSSRSTGPPTGTSFKTTTTLPTPSSPETTLPTPVQPLATSSVTATSHPVTTPTTETISSSPSSSPHTGTSRTTTAAPSTGTRSTPSTPPLTKTTIATGSSHSSISTAKTTSPPLSLPPSTAPASSTSPPHTTVTPKPTTTATGTPVPETTSPVSHSQPHTTSTTLSQPTVSASSSSRSTGPPTEPPSKPPPRFQPPQAPRPSFPLRSRLLQPPR